MAPIPEPNEPTLSLKPDLPTGQILTKGQLKQRKLPLRVRLRNLRAGGRWSVYGAAVLFVCWALWAGQSGRESLTSSGLVLVLILLVAVGLFAVSRLAGGIILEKLLSRTRRGAVLSHVAIGLFLAFAGVSLLRQVDWVIDAWSQVRGIR